MRSFDLHDNCAFKPYIIVMLQYDQSHSQSEKS